MNDCSEKSASIVPYVLFDCSFTVHFTDQAFSLFHYCKNTISWENWVAIFSIFLRDSITGFAACRVSRLFRVSSRSPLLWPPHPSPSANVGMQLLNAASMPPFSRRWKMRARWRLRRLNLSHLSVCPWLLDVPFRFSALKREQRRSVFFFSRLRLRI